MKVGGVLDDGVPLIFQLGGFGQEEAIATERLRSETQIDALTD